MDLVQDFERKLWEVLNIKIVKDSLTPVKIRKDGSVTVVFWNDGTATSVRCSADDTYDDYIAFCAALAKRVLGSTSAVKRAIHDCPVELADEMRLKSVAAAVEKTHSENKIKDMMSNVNVGKEYTSHISSENKIRDMMVNPGKEYTFHISKVDVKDID